MAERRRSYEAVAWCYDAIARVYSLGAISRAKAHSVERLRTGDRVLYAGIGTGEEAVLAARRGAAVTGIDLSPRMLRAARRRFAAAGQAASLVLGDFFEHRPEAPYDMVAANFVLDVFGPEEAARALAHLASLVRPGGWLTVSDFAPPTSGRLHRCLTAAYYRPVNVAGFLLGLCTLHPLYDYALGFDALGFEVCERRGFGLWKDGPQLYESLIGRKRVAESAPVAGSPPVAVPH